MFKGRDFPFNDIGEMTSHEDTLVKREITPLEHQQNMDAKLEL